MSSGFLACIRDSIKLLFHVFIGFIYGTMLHTLIARALYFPSIVKLMLRKGQWYNRIDDTVVLGALPFRSQSSKLVNDEKVSAVLSLNQPYELKLFSNSTEQWKSLGVRHFLYITWDFQPPTIESIVDGLKIIDEERQKQKSVYVHCKAGRGRSATLVTCYLMKRYKLSPSDAIDFLERKRPQVSMNKHQRETLTEYYEKYLASKSK